MKLSEPLRQVLFVGLILFEVGVQPLEEKAL